MKDNIKVNLKEIRCEDVGLFIQLRIESTGGLF
jgi:hypothetical protein